MSDYDEGYRAGMRDMAHKRIEDLENKLAKVVSAGVRVRDYYGRYTNIDVYAVSDFNAVVEELKGQNGGWKCPINCPNCEQNCGNYGCGN